ncbi:MAG: prepilin-type N-terminal cleavage/methylation domain-containing protein [Sphingobacteriia bacterium]|nr:prepilin-type N-terminal cleavage/methylation domain-containing protein [Sphingobacteriia bacterium]NCC41291.1 prepilin-type N-terminal cleavage/methylation domain-containing protein [Gammaproteobacteria bacterium]
MRSQHGFTLVELLIAMVLGLLLTGAVIQAQAAARQVLAMQTALNRQSISILAASDLLARHIREAGYGTSAGNAITGTVDRVSVTYNDAIDPSLEQQDCAGHPLAAVSTDTFLIATHVIDGVTVSFLGCQPNGGDVELLVPDIADLAFRYYDDGVLQPLGEIPTDWATVDGVRLTYTALGDPAVSVPDQSITLSIGVRARILAAGVQP